MEDASSLRYGCLVRIITVCGGSAFTLDKQAILQRGSGFLRDCLLERSGAQASRLTDAMGKGSFHIILFKTQVFHAR